MIGNLLRERNANGVVADHVYDSLNRLDVLREFMDNNGNGVFDAGDDLLTRFDYTVRADGRRTGAVEQFRFEGEMHENTVAQADDNLGRLVDEVFDHHEDAFDQTDRFVHDLVGNRLEQTRDLGNDGTIDETTGSVRWQSDRRAVRPRHRSHQRPGRPAHIGRPLGRQRIRDASGRNPRR